MDVKEEEVDEQIEKLLDLMKRYVAYIKKCTGKNYIKDTNWRERAGIKFTDREWELLKTLTEK